MNQSKNLLKIRNKKNYRGRGRRGGSNGQGLNFTHFYAFPLWYEIPKEMNNTQNLFKEFVKKEFPEHEHNFSFQSFKSAHLTISMLDLSIGK